MFFRVFVLAVSIAGPVASSPLAYAQAAASSSGLTAGINQVKTGDYFGALVTLNAVVSELAGGTDQASLVARARAYQALAYMLLDQPDRAREFALLSLAADPNVAIDTPEFTPAVAALFSELRRPATAQSPEAVGDAAIQAGAIHEAFLAYLRAFQELPEPLTAAVDHRLREKIVRAVQKMGTKPVIGDDARSRFTKAQDLLDAEAILGGAAGKASEQAAVELRHAIRLAPWWGDAAFRLATVLQRLNRVDEALVNLGIYRVADPEGFAARAGRAAPRDLAAAPAPTAAAPKPAGPALIYIYWPEQQRGGGRQKVYCNGQQVAELQNNRFVVLRAAAGTHDLAFRNKHVAAVVEADRAYHFRTSIEGHWQFAMGPEIRLVARAAAEAEMSQQDMKVNDARRTRSAECAVPTPATRDRRR